MKHFKLFILLLILNALVISLACACSDIDKEADQNNDTLDISSTADKETYQGETNSAKETTSRKNQGLTETSKTEFVREEPSESVLEGEPDSPVEAIMLYQTEQGISDRNAERFFKTFSTTPVYYSYEMTSLSDEKVTEIQLAIDDASRTYMKIQRDELLVEVISTRDGQYFELDSINKVATEISQTEAQGNFISKETFEKIYNQAELLYYVGEGQAKFFGEDVTFEEYTTDNKIFLRYYFTDDQVLGHRTLEDNQIISTVKINTLKNYFTEEMDMFELPPDFKVYYLEEGPEQ